MKYFDAHCHVQFDAFYDDQAEVLARMREEDIGGIVVGVDFESSRKAVELVESHENLFAAVGLHPNRVLVEEFDLSAYRFLAENPKVVAIGECGLDYYRPQEVNDEVKARQKRLFQDQVALAAELDKPLIIHSRPSAGSMDAYEDLIEILKEAKVQHTNLRGDIHFFVGTVEIAKQFFDLGFTVSFTAVVTFTHDYDEVIKTAPLGSILSETDAPYVAPASRRRERNDPLSVRDVVAQIALIRGEDAETVRATLLANAQRLFSLPNA